MLTEELEPDVIVFNNELTPSQIPEFILSIRCEGN